MKKYLLIGLALFLANSFTSADAADSCGGVSVTNASGSPPVVVGNTVQIVAWGPSPFFLLSIDGQYVQLWDPNPNDPPGTYFSSSFSVSLPYGNHSLQANWDSCVLNFSNVAPPQSPPPAPTLSDGNGGVACPNDPLSWTSVPDASFYALYKRQIAPVLEPSMNQIWSGSGTSLRVTVPRGSTYTYAVTACSSNGCSGFSNFKIIRGGICQ